MLNEIDQSPLNVREKFLVKLLASEVQRAFQEGMPLNEIKKAIHYFMLLIRYKLRKSRTNATRHPSLPNTKGAVSPQPPTSPPRKPLSPPDAPPTKVNPNPASPIAARAELMDELKRRWARRDKFVLILE